MDSPVKLVIAGHPRANNIDVVDAVIELNKTSPGYELLGYIAPSESEENPCRIKYLGGLEEAALLPPEVMIYPGIGQRVERFREIGLPLERYATIIHPGAYVSPFASVGRGTFIAAGCTVGGYNVRIGNFVVMLQQVGVSHDDVLGDYSTVTCGVKMSGRVKIGGHCFICTGAVIVDGASVGAGSVVGAGAVVRHDVPPGEVWVGNPARFLRRQDESSPYWNYTGGGAP